MFLRLDYSSLLALAVRLSHRFMRSSMPFDFDWPSFRSPATSLMRRFHWSLGWRPRILSSSYCTLSILVFSTRILYLDQLITEILSCSCSQLYKVFRPYLWQNCAPKVHLKTSRFVRPQPTHKAFCRSDPSSKHARLSLPICWRLSFFLSSRIPLSLHSTWTTYLCHSLWSRGHPVTQIAGKPYYHRVSAKPCLARRGRRENRSRACRVSH